MTIAQSIDKLVSQAVKETASSTDTLKYTQAALNLAHVMATYDAIENTESMDK